MYNINIHKMLVALVMVTVIIFIKSSHSALIISDVPAQTSIGEDTKVVTTLPNTNEITLQNVTGDDISNAICYMQHISPQLNTDLLIGPFEARRSGSNRADFQVVYDPENGFPISPFIASFYQTRFCCYDVRAVSDAPTCLPLFITVTKNSAPTVSGMTEVTIESESDPGETVVRLTAADAENDPLTFSLSTDPVEARNLFTVDSTGLVTTTVNGKSIPFTPIILRTSVSDGKSSATLTTTVTINFVNSRPNILELPLNITIPEDAVAGTALTTLRVADVDGFAGVTGDVVPECTINPRGESAKFTFDTNRDTLRLSNISERPLDFESVSFYNITCVVSDGFLSSQGETLGLFVRDVNEAPVFVKPQHTCNLVEAAAGESFCSVSFTATDPEKDTVTLSLGGNFSDRFALTDNNKRLTFAVDYDLEAISTPSLVTLFVLATDPFGATGTTTLNVAISDVNDNDPQFASDITTIPLEFSTAIGRIGAFTATDRDQGSNGAVEFSLVNIVPPDAATHFNLFNNGEIFYLSQFPDTLAGTSALIVAEAKDKGNPVRSATSTIAITFGTTTTSSTSTSSTTTSTTTTTTTTTVATPTTTPFNFWARPENVLMFILLMLLLLLGLLALLWLCLRYCGIALLPMLRQCFTSCFRCEPGSCYALCERCRGLDCNCDCCRPKRVRPQVVRSINYSEDFWRKSDHYESGKPFN